MGSVICPNPVWTHTFLRKHVRELTSGGKLAAEILGLESLRLPDEDAHARRWELLQDFLYPREGHIGPRYIDIPFHKLDSNLAGTNLPPRSLPDVINESHERGVPILLVTGSTGSGKTTACVRAFVDILEGNPPFGSPARGGSGKPPPQLAAWVRDFRSVEGSLWWDLKESANRRQCLLGYMPPTAFFFDLDRIPTSRGREKVAQALSDFAQQHGSGPTRPRGHMVVAMCRSETLGLRDQRRLFHDQPSEVWQAADLSGEHGEAMTLSYLKGCFGLGYRFVSALRRRNLLPRSPLFLFLLGQYLRLRHNHATTPNTALASPGRLFSYFVDYFHGELDAPSHNLTPAEMALIRDKTAGIALAMIDRRTFVITRADLEAIIECRYVPHEPVLNQLFDYELAGQGLGLSEQRLVEEEPASVVDLVCRHGFLRPEEEGYSFIHDNLRDFLVGDLLAKQQRNKPRRGFIGPFDLKPTLRRKALVLLDSALTFAVDLLPAKEGIDLAERVLGEPLLGAKRRDSHLGVPRIRLIERILSSNFDYFPKELATQLASELAFAAMLNLGWGKESGADLDLLSRLPSFVLNLLVEVQPDIADACARGLHRMAAGDPSRAAEVAHRIANACERRRDHVRSFELRRRAVELGSSEQTTRWVLELLRSLPSPWMLEQLRSPHVAARAAYPDEDGSTQLAALVRALLLDGDRPGAALPAVLAGLGTPKVHDVLQQLRAAGYNGLAGTWQCTLIEHDILAPESLDLGALCAALSKPDWVRTVLRVMKRPQVMTQIRNSDYIPKLARAVVDSGAQDKEALGFLVDICLAGDVGTSEPILIEYLRSEFLASPTSAIEVLVVPNRVHALFDLFSAEGQVKSVRVALSTLDVSARRGLFVELEALAEQSTSAPFVRWACKRAIMTLPKQEFESEKQSVVETTLADFVGLPVEELESAYRVLDAYRKSKPDVPYWQSCQERLRGLVSDAGVRPEARSWVLPLLDNDEELRPDDLLRILNSIAAGTSHGVYRDRVMQVSHMMRRMNLSPSEALSVLGWARECVRLFESSEDDDDLKVCDSAAWLIRRIVDRFLAEEERAELLQHCVFLSDHKSRETRDVLFKTLESYGILETAELLERVRGTSYHELGDSVHRFEGDCARVAKAIRRRLEEQER